LLIRNTNDISKSKLCWKLEHFGGNLYVTIHRISSKPPDLNVAHQRVYYVKLTPY